MKTPRRSHGRGRELAVIGAGLAACAALLLAGVSVHDGLAAAGEVAVARLSGAVEDTVVAEWERMLRSGEPPVPPAGETFRWSEKEEPLEPLALRELWIVPERPSVFRTLLAEAERHELVEGDLEGALELVLEALNKEPESSLLPEGRLRAVQLALRLDRPVVVRLFGESLRGVELTDTRAGIPYRFLGELILPPQRSSNAVSDWMYRELGRLFVEEDRLTLGPPEAPEARFELAPLLASFYREVGHELDPSWVRRRKVHQLQEMAALPAVPEDGRWHWDAFAGRPFCARKSGGTIEGFFASLPALREALALGSGLPEGFALDFSGDEASLGVALRPPTALAGTTQAFVLRHADPTGLKKAEFARLELLRGALFVLAFACAAGGFLTARVLARQRKLAELRTAFIAGVSHDLRTPLASILLVTENLESGVAGEAERPRYHRALRKEALRLRRLIDDVLDFSRLERGQAPSLQREDLDLAGFVDGLSADLRERVTETGREFVCERGALPPSAALDGHALRRALENLVDNALKHGRGAVKLAVAAVGGRLCLRVGDEGPGVPAAERERVFEPFERATSGAQHVGGTGLGLAIVRSIARAHGGEARVRVEPAGTGTVFELDLPLEDDA